MSPLPSLHKILPTFCYLVVIIVYLLQTAQAAFDPNLVCNTPASTLMTTDTDGDGIPDPLEVIDNRKHCVKDNDIFTVNSLFVKQ